MLSRNLTCFPNENDPTYYYKSKLSLNSTSGNMSDIIVEEFPITFEGYTYTGHIAYQKEEVQTRRPVVLVFPNYSGEKQFDVDQAVFLAKCGYVGLSCDLYEDDYIYPRAIRAPTPSSSKEELIAHMKGSFTRMNIMMGKPKSWRGLMDLYLTESRKHKSVHPHYAASIGYCLGGSCVLECLRHGCEMQAIVSFHGVLQSNAMHIDYNEDGTVIFFNPNKPGGKRKEYKDGEKPINNYNKHCRVLIENAVTDHLVTARSKEKFFKEMEENGIEYRINTHGPHVQHGFALGPDCFNNEYDETADRRSTMNMLQLFWEVWPEFPPQLDAMRNDATDNIARNACGTALPNMTFGVTARL